MLAVARRSPGDCLRAAVSVAYGWPYDDTPAGDGGQHPLNTVIAGTSWQNWALERGLRWCWSWQAAPIFQPRWIAVVDGLGDNGRRGEGVIHAVAMQHAELLYEPTEGRGPTYTKIHPTDVRRAMWLVPAGAPNRFTGRCWTIPHPEDCPEREPGVHRHTPRPKRHEPRPKVGRNDPCPCGSGVKVKRCCGAR